MITFISYIGEALALSDRIIILTKRPGKIKKEIKTNFPDKNTITIRNTTQFREYLDNIWKEIDNYE